MTKTEYVVKWCRETKKRLVAGFGGKCCVCGYSKCQEAMDIHHLDASTKEFTISSYVVKNKAKIYEEAKKCVLLCANCHREYHAGMTLINNPVKFDESLIPKKPVKLCGICGIQTKNMRFCSPKCSSIYSRKSGLSDEDILELVKTKKYTEIAVIYNVTENAIRKRHKKLLALSSAC